MNRWIVFSAMALVAAASLAHANIEGKVPLFLSDDVLPVKIQGNFPEVNKANAPQNNSSPGKLTYAEDGKTTTLDIQLAARGNGRSWWCHFAPLRLILGAKGQSQEQIKEQTKHTIFKHAHHAFRLVTHCKNTEFMGDGSYDDTVLTEYATYQILLASGLPALKTRLAHAEYFDQRGRPFETGYLLILENVGDMAQRYKKEDINRKKGAPQVLEKTRVPFELGLRLVASEADHGYNLSKNSFFIGSKLPNGEFDINTATPVPYDFVLNPQAFPFSRKELHHSPGWIRKYVSLHPALKTEVINTLTLILSHQRDMENALDSVPYRKGAFQKQNLQQWTREFLADAEQYLREN